MQNSLKILSEFKFLFLHHCQNRPERRLSGIPLPASPPSSFLLLKNSEEKSTPPSSGLEEEAGQFKFSVKSRVFFNTKETSTYMYNIDEY